MASELKKKKKIVQATLFYFLLLFFTYVVVTYFTFTTNINKNGKRKTISVSLVLSHLQLFIHKKKFNFELTKR